jgi:hypothetical protein
MNFQEHDEKRKYKVFLFRRSSLSLLTLEMFIEKQILLLESSTT